MASSSTAIPTYSELRSIRRRNASALAQKALDLVTRNGGVMPGPEIMPIFDPSKPLPAPSFMRRFMYRSPSLVLSAASLLQIAALFVFLLPHLSEYCKENQLYEAFALPWVERVLLGSQQVIYFGGVVVVAQIAMLVFMLRSRDDDEKPSALQWFATLLTIVEAGLAFRFSDKPEFAAGCAMLFVLLALWDEILRQRLFRGAELDAATASMLQHKEKIAVLDEQLEQQKILTKIERETNARVETLLRQAREETDTMQEALLVAASEMDRFQLAAREKFGDTAFRSLLGGAAYLGEGIFPGGVGGGAEDGAIGGYGAGGAVGAGGAAGGAALGGKRRSSRDGDFPEEEEEREEDGSTAEQIDEADGSEEAEIAKRNSSGPPAGRRAAGKEAGNSAAAAASSSSSSAAGTGVLNLAASPSSSSSSATASGALPTNLATLTSAERALAMLDAGVIGSSGKRAGVTGSSGSVISAGSSRTGASRGSQRSRRAGGATRLVIKPDGSSYLVTTEE